MAELTKEPEPAVRQLGTMVTYGFPKEQLATDLAIATWLGASQLEILPHWQSSPHPEPLRSSCEQSGIAIQSVHASWGRQSPSGIYVDLASTNSQCRQSSLDIVRSCLDWLEKVGGRYLVIHPGGLSERSEFAPRSEALISSLNSLADAVGEASLRICLENMPPGVYPGQSMSDLREIVENVNRAQVGFALDTGHAHIASSLEVETRAAGQFLWTTHVHDNNGKADSHLAPGAGGIDWVRWSNVLDEIGYQGTITLECIRQLRENPKLLNPELKQQLRVLTRR